MKTTRNDRMTQEQTTMHGWWAFEVVRGYDLTAAQVVDKMGKVQYNADRNVALGWLQTHLDFHRDARKQKLSDQGSLVVWKVFGGSGLDTILMVYKIGAHYEDDAAGERRQRMEAEEDARYRQQQEEADTRYREQQAAEDDRYRRQQAEEEARYQKATAEEQARYEAQKAREEREWAEEKAFWQRCREQANGSHEDREDTYWGEYHQQQERQAYEQQQTKRNAPPSADITGLYRSYIKQYHPDRYVGKPCHAVLTELCKQVTMHYAQRSPNLGAELNRLTRLAQQATGA